MTNTSNTPTIAIGGLDSGQTYEFNVSASYSLPLLRSGENVLRQATRRKLRVLRVERTQR